MISMVSKGSVGRILASNTTQTDMDDDCHSPDHPRCCSDMLNLVAATDAEQVFTCETYKSLSEHNLQNIRPYGLQLDGVLKHQTILKN